MRSRALLGWTIGTVLLCGLALGGCRKSEEQKAKETAQAFLNAADTDNDAAMKNTLTEQARRNIKTEKNDRTVSGFDGGYTLENAVVQDGTGKVYFVLKDKDGDATPGHFKMRREE